MSDNKLVLKKKYLDGLAKWLQETYLTGPESRIRTRFVRLLIDEIIILEEKRVEILKKYANKDEDGQPSVMMTPEGKKMYDVSEEKVAEVNKEMSEYLETECEFVIEDPKIIDIVLNTPEMFGAGHDESAEVQAKAVRLASDYSEWCRAFEKVRL